MFYDVWVGCYGYANGLSAGLAAWDRTDGHQLDLTVQTTDTTSTANVTVTGFVICGAASEIGCTSTAVAGAHIVEGSSEIEFKTGVSSCLIEVLAAHEFGRYAVLGHSASSSATMWDAIPARQATLSTWDERSRCQVCGHAHDYWGGC